MASTLHRQQLVTHTHDSCITAIACGKGVCVCVVSFTFVSSFNVSSLSH